MRIHGHQVYARQATRLDLRQGRNALPAPRTDARSLPPGLPAVVASDTRNSPALAVRNRPAPALLAQLIAGAEDMPIMRTRRRADPETGAASYRAVAELGSDLPRGKLRIF